MNALPFNWIDLVVVAAIGVGTWHYVRFRKKEKERAHVSVSPVGDGGMITFGGSF